MNRYLCTFCLILLVSVSGSSFSEPVTDNSNYWQCVTMDAGNNQWNAKSIYQKIAMNMAFAACKKLSKAPASCRASKGNCEQFIQGNSVKPMWQCTALDREALPWQSDLYAQRDDAALAAEAYCRQKSSVPETCYINLIACINKNEI